MKNNVAFRSSLIGVLLLTSVGLLFNSGCAISFKKDHWDLPPKSSQEISVMSFNVENLFDTEHTPGHEDYAYLPMVTKLIDPKMKEGCLSTNDSPFRRNECLTSDWTPEALNKKLTNLSKVILGVDENGPDNLMLIEIESQKVLSQLNNDYLKKANYITQVLIDGPDKRGINLGFLSRFPLFGPPVLHPIPWKPKNEEDKKWMERSRRILEVNVIAPNGKPITFFVAHFPSQANPTYWREQVAQYLAELIKNKGPNAVVVAGGDLNITHDEEEENHIFRNILSKAGAVSHFVGCEKCMGTHHFKKSWSFLDAHIYGEGVLPQGKGSYELEPKTIDVIRYNPLHLKRGKYPARWDDENLTGVSDHFPLYARLKERTKSNSK